MGGFSRVGHFYWEKKNPPKFQFNITSPPLLMINFIFLCVTLCTIFSVFSVNSTRENTPISEPSSASDSDDSVVIIEQTPPPPVYEGPALRPRRFINGVVPPEDIPYNSDLPGLPHLFEFMMEYPPLYVPHDDVPYFHMRNGRHLVNWANRSIFPQPPVMRRLLRTMDFGHGFHFLLREHYTPQMLSSRPVFHYEHNLTEFLENHRLRYARYRRARYTPSESDNDEPAHLSETAYYSAEGNQLILVVGDRDEDGHLLPPYVRHPIIIRTWDENRRLQRLIQQQPEQGPALPPDLLGRIDEGEDDYEHVHNLPAHRLMEQRYWGLNQSSHERMIENQLPYAEAWPEDTQAASQATMEQETPEEQTRLRNIIRQARERIAQHQIRPATASEMIASSSMTAPSLGWDPNNIRLSNSPPPLTAPPESDSEDSDSEEEDDDDPSSMF